MVDQSKDSQRLNCMYRNSSSTIKRSGTVEPAPSIASGIPDTAVEIAARGIIYNDSVISDGKGVHMIKQSKYNSYFS
jgi:hypothetical protein